MRKTKMLISPKQCESDFVESLTPRVSKQDNLNLKKNVLFPKMTAILNF